MRRIEVKRAGVITACLTIAGLISGCTFGEILLSRENENQSPDNQVGTTTSLMCDGLPTGEFDRGFLASEENALITNKVMQCLLSGIDVRATILLPYDCKFKKGECSPTRLKLLAQNGDFVKNDAGHEIIKAKDESGNVVEISRRTLETNTIDLIQNIDNDDQVSIDSSNITEKNGTVNPIEIGYSSVESKVGVELWQKGDVFAVVVDPKQSEIKILNLGKFMTYNTIWDKYSDSAIAMVGGTHYLEGNIQYSYKDGDMLVRRKVNPPNGVNQLMLVIDNNGQARVVEYNEAEIQSSGRLVIGGDGLTSSQREMSKPRARTVVGINGDGEIIIWIFKLATRDEILKVIKLWDINPNKVINIGGGGQAVLDWQDRGNLIANKEVAKKTFNHVIMISSK